MKIVYLTCQITFGRAEEKVLIDLCNNISKKYDVYFINNEFIKNYINLSRVKFIKYNFNQNRFKLFAA